MRHRPLVLSWCCCLLSCGGIAEYSEDDPRGDGSPDDAGLVPEDSSPSIPLPTDEPVPDCSGDFAEPQLLFEDRGWISQALTPSASGLEFYYARLAVDRSLDDSGTRLPTVRTRPTIEADFGEPVILYELSTACEQARTGTELAALDLSPDGLRLYIGCSPFVLEPTATGPLLMFARKDVDATFLLPPTVVGEVGISLGLTRDELTAFGTSIEPSVDEVLWYKRSSTEQPFGPPEIAPGSIIMTNPEPSPDGLELWGAIDVPATTRMQIAVSSWNEQARAYEPPRAALVPPPEGYSDYSPALSRDCRRLYFSRYTSSPSTISQVMLVRR